MIQQLGYIVLLALTPVVELRGALIWAYTYGITPIIAIPIATIASTLLGLASYFLSEWILSIAKRHIKWYHRRIVSHINAIQQKQERWIPIAIILFIGIPAPGTGAFTGGILAAALGIPPKTAAKCIAVGNLMASLLITGLFFPLLF